MVNDEAILLICTVGGSPEPVIAAIKDWGPKRVRFVPSPETRGDIDHKILPGLAALGVAIDTWDCETLQLTDSQDLERCVDELRALSSEVTSWAGRPGGRVVVDITGGTKCMTAAMALQGSRWPCTFSYVGGTERSKAGVGVVVSGAERVHDSENPWAGLGYRAVEEFVTLFDQSAFGPAARKAREAREKIDRPDRRQEFAALENLALGLHEWDRFRHARGLERLKAAIRAANDLRAMFPDESGERLVRSLTAVDAHLAKTRPANYPSHWHVVDLLANAGRRKAEDRVDDAVARLYRAIEATAQVALRDRHGIQSTGKVPLDSIPETLRCHLQVRASGDNVSLGLQDSYRLLREFGDDVGQKFQDLGLEGRESPLGVRNQSILAHGFVPVPDSTYDSLWRSALALADLDEASIPTVPKLGQERQKGDSK